MFWTYHVEWLKYPVYIGVRTGVGAGSVPAPHYFCRGAPYWWSLHFCIQFSGISSEQQVCTIPLMQEQQ